MSVCFFQAEDGIRYLTVTGVQTCALPISLVSDAALAEHLRTDAGLQRFLDPLHARVGGPVDVHLRREGGIAGFEEFDERLAGEARPHDDQGLSDLRRSEGIQDVLEEDCPRVPRREHLPVSRGSYRPELPHAIRMQYGAGRLV